jgi:glycosyltransferase involved in cell wall biosynthesis
MGRLVFAIPGDISAHTGGYAYGRRMLAELPRFGVETVHLPLPGRFPEAEPHDVALALDAMQATLQPGDVLLVDGLAYGALPEAAISAIATPIVALCHHPLCLEAGLTPEREQALRENERAALALARRVIVSSTHVADILRDHFGVPSHRLAVAPPGTDPSARPRGSGGGAPAMIAVGAISPRKAYPLLLEALSGLAQLDWRLRIVGSRDLSPAAAAALAAKIEALGLEARIDLVGGLAGDELEEAYAASDIFVASSLFEGFGMALAEAMARGLPIVTTTGGAAAETVPDDAALKIPPSNVRALREALRKMLSDGGLRRKLAEGSWRAGQALPQWRDSASTIARIFRAIAEE